MKNPDILKEIPLFSCLEDDQLLELSEIMVETTYREDTIIIQKGDASRSLYVVLSGFAIAPDRDEDGKLIFLNEFEQGGPWMTKSGTRAPARTTRHRRLRR